MNRNSTWWRAQDILDNTERVTNTSGSIKRKYLGSGLFRCGVCGGEVIGVLRGYRCAGHAMRTGSYIDEFVIEVTAEQFRRPDTLRKHKMPDTGPEAAGISPAIADAS